MVHAISSLVFIDPTVADYQSLITGLEPGTEAIVIEKRCPFEQITQALSQGNYQRLVIVAHGEPGKMYLGNTLVTRQTLEEKQGLLAEWAIAEILLCSCEVGADPEFVATLERHTHSRVIASATRLGAGVWLPEIETVFAAATLTHYAHTLAFVVTNTNDSGAGSLRQAILDVNASASGDTITFVIPTSDPKYNAATGEFTISPSAAGLPAITKPVIIDGYSQTGALPNTSSTNINAILKIRIDGINVTVNRIGGLSLGGGSDNSRIQGLAFTRFTAGGIGAGILVLGGSGQVIRGNFFGTNTTGTAVGLGNTRGVAVNSGGSNVLIGGSAVGDRNLISGNTQAGILFDGGSNNVVLGNLIGLQRDGVTPLGNIGRGGGVWITSGSDNNTIGGLTAGDRNIISGNSVGVSIDNYGSDNNTVIGNYIGTDVTGTLDRGNTSDGVQIIGTQSGGAVGNSVRNNLISGNDKSGVIVFGPLASNNSITQNAIVNNTLLGIDLGSMGGDGVTANDNNDGDTGANNLQNFPVITSAIFNGTDTVITGTLNSTTSTTFTIELFSNTAPDPTSFGEGQTILGTATIASNPSNNRTFSFTAPGNLTGKFITATATSAAGSTSEFSAAAIVAAIVPVANAAPILNNSGAPALTAIAEDVTSAANTGTKVADLIAGLITDGNGDPKAIAITGANTTNGTWQYSTNGGTIWTPLTAPSDSNATVLGATSFYSANLGTAPSSQTWLSYTAVNIPVSGAPTPATSTETTSASGALVNTTSNQRIYAGYSNYNTSNALVNANSPTLSNTAGYSVSFDLQVLADSNTNASRAGFSVLLVSQDTTKAIELGFQRLSATTGKIFAQNASFVAEEAIAYNTNVKTDYRVEVLGNTYKLFANDTQILTGALRDYSSFAPPANFPFDPYEKPGLIFLGDDTTSAQGAFNLSQVVVQTDNRVRFVPNANYNGSDDISFRAWDTTDGKAVGAIANASVNGGATPFSSAVETATIAVNAVPDITSITPPTNGSYGTGQNLDFTVVFDEAVTVTGTPSFPITLNTGGVVNATYVSGSGSTSLLFRYTVATGNIDADGIVVGSAIALNSGTINNAGGKNAGLTLPVVVSSGILVDGVAPTVAIALSESNLKSGETATVTFTFSETPTGFEASDITAENGEISGLTVTSDAKVYTGTFTPTVNIADTTSIIAVANTYADAAGNSGTAGTSANYSVETTAPTISSITSTTADGIYGIGSTINLTVNFSENVILEDGALILTLDTGATVNITAISGTNTAAGSYTVAAGQNSSDLNVRAIALTTGATLQDTAGNNAILTPPAGANSLAGSKAIVINNAPTMSGTPEIAIAEDSPYTFTPSTTDVDDDTLTFSITNAPTWATFDPTTGQLSGIPTNGDVGTTTGIVIRVSDLITPAVDLPAFDLTVSNTNDAPTVANAIADQTATEDTAFSFVIPTETFNDIDGDTLIYRATLEDDRELPTWLSFDDATRTFSGIPLNTHVGRVNVKVTAMDGTGENPADASVSDVFELAVENANDAPTVANAIADQTTSQNTAFSFQLPSNTFADPDLGDRLTYSAKLKNGSALPTWLQFNAATQTFSGMPSVVEAIEIDVSAEDRGGLMAIDTFELRITAAPPTLPNPPTPPISPVQPIPPVQPVRASKLSLSVNEGNTNAVNELIFIATDTQGRINGILPDSPGYNETFLANATTVFSTLKTGRLPGLKPSRTINLNEVTNLQFAIIENGSLDSLRNGGSGTLRMATSLTGDTSIPASSFQTSTTELHLQVQLSGGAIQPLTLNTNVSETPAALGTQLQGNASSSELFDFRGETGTKTATFEVFRDAGFDNIVGLYAIENEQGQVRDSLGLLLSPGDAGYSQAALANRLTNVNLTGTNEQVKTFTAEIAMGQLLSTFIIVDGTLEAALDLNTGNDPSLYFTHLGANADRTDHVRLMGDNTFGFEDLRGGGDLDFDDVVVKATFV